MIKNFFTILIFVGKYSFKNIYFNRQTMQLYKKDSNQGLFQTLIVHRIPCFNFCLNFHTPETQNWHAVQVGEGEDLFFFIHITHVPCLSKIYSAEAGVFWRTLQSFQQHKERRCFQKNYFLHTLFQLKVPIFTNNFTQVTFS